MMWISGGYLGDPFRGSLFSVADSLSVYRLLPGASSSFSPSIFSPLHVFQQRIAETFSALLLRVQWGGKQVSTKRADCIWSFGDIPEPAVVSAVGGQGGLRRGSMGVSLDCKLSQLHWTVMHRGASKGWPSVALCAM